MLSSIKKRTNTIQLDYLIISLQKRKLMIIDFNQKNKEEKNIVSNYYEFYFAGGESLHVYSGICRKLARRVSRLRSTTSHIICR